MLSSQTRSVGSAMGLKQLIGERSRLDEVFLPHSLYPFVLAEELRHEMQMDRVNDGLAGADGGNEITRSHHGAGRGVTTGEDRNHNQNHSDRASLAERPGARELTTRIIVDALVTTPTATTRWYQASLTSLLLTVVTVLLLACGRNYIRTLLLWLQEVDLAVGLVIFSVLFFLVSLPVIWGYMLLLLAAGYLYGCMTGPLVVLACSGLGLAAAHAVMRTCCRSYFRGKFLSAKVEAVLTVMNRGPGFKIVALTRLTPIPFGLQNALFSLSDMNLVGYLGASLAGLSPMAFLYCYMGSTLRTMEDVLYDQGNQATGWFIFGGQMLFTVALLCFVARKARAELHKAMEQSAAQDALAKSLAEETPC